ncbi:MAG: ADP-ribosylglycohydrolase family protein [Kiritimatiellae bacterium]|nr:ADP-ribosylglycohydrolase family protein [Kiritimatiellia bacterium]
MDPIRLSRTPYRDKVYACWMGKNIGGTLGGPWECKRYPHGFTFYEPTPEKSAPNDDLDLQLVWLKMLEDEGVDPSVRTFAEYWSRYATRYPPNEYGFFMRNFERGLRPPVAGCFENYFVDEMGSPIRSEIWACLHPADPQAAARMAWKDSAIDHSGGEGMNGELFWAAVESAAFVETDPMTLIRIGLNMIPLSSHLARSVREAVWCHENGVSWGEARERIVSRFATVQPCNAVPNAAFIVIGWLYGTDYGDKLCKAVNCGYDTDCTGATLGSLLGILGGTAGIPAKWREPIGEQIVLCRFTGSFNSPKTVEELTQRTVALAERVAAEKGTIEFGAETVLPADIRSRLFRNAAARRALQQDPHVGTELVDGEEVRLHYGGEPVLRPDVEKELWVTAGEQREPAVELEVPGGWTCIRTGPSAFRVRASGEIADRNTLTVRLNGKRAAFTILGPGEAKGYAAGMNVPRCPTCRARAGSCECP